MQGAIKRLRKVKQAGSVKDYLLGFNNAVADCSSLSSEDKLRYFVDGLDPEIRRSVYVCRPGTMSEATKLATYLREDVEGSKKERGELGGWRKGEFRRSTYVPTESRIQQNNKGRLRARDPSSWSGVMWKSGPSDRENPPPLSPGRGFINTKKPDYKRQRCGKSNQGGYRGYGHQIRSPLNRSTEIFNTGERRGTWGIRSGEDRKVVMGTETRGDPELLELYVTRVGNLVS